MSTPINAETFLPELLADYIDSQRTALGLGTALNLYPWPWVGDMERPFLAIEASQFKFDAHPATQDLEVVIMLDYGVDGEPVTGETAAQSTARRAAMLAAENAMLAKIRAALALRPGQTITFTGAVTSLWDWITDDRVVPAGEDGWALEEFVVASGGGSISYAGERRIRTRLTNYHARIMTNEFTV